MRFSFRRDDSIPRLAWCARVTRGDSTVLVEAGSWVETFTNGFVEGAWNGTFASLDFTETDILLGSGAALVGDRVAFATTTHTMERLQSVRVRDALFVSNSFAYLLAATDDALDATYRLYEHDFLTFLNGIHRAKTAIQTRNGRTIRLHYNEIFLIGRDLSLRAHRPQCPPPFQTFAEYMGYLANVIRGLHENAAAPERTIRYTPLSTISSGYDSPACTVLAKAIGCTRAVTFGEARQRHNPKRVKDPDDSGTRIAEYLSIEVETFSRDDYLHQQDFPEAEFLASGNGGDDVVMSALERALPRTVFFTGFLGDTLWGTSGPRPQWSRHYTYGYPAGGSLGEFRIRVGFVHAPVPLFTFTRHPEIAAITRSPEMAPWRVGGQYDRPIPRRIVESCGVPRDIYAQEKKAISQPFWITPDVATFMSKHSYDDLIAFHSTIAMPWHKTVYAAFRALRVRILSRLQTTPLRVVLAGLRRVFPVSFFTVSRLDLIAFNLLTSVSGVKFHWAVEKVLPRYSRSQFRHGLSSRDQLIPR